MNTMTDTRSIAIKLIEANVVNFRPEEPFIWASGWKSPIYCDNRRLLSIPYIRDFFKSELGALVFSEFPDVDAIAGVATAGIPWGTMVSDQLKLPFMYVRPKPKEHGMGNQIEGAFTAGQRVLVVEDLISTGKSSLQVCDALTNQGLKVEGMVAIFTYGFPQAEKAFLKSGITLRTLTNYKALVEEAAIRGIVSEKMVDTLLNWRQDPENWMGIL